MAELERFSDVTQYFHTWDGGHTVPLQKGETQQPSSRKVLNLQPLRATDTHIRQNPGFSLGSGLLLLPIQSPPE